MPKHQKRHALSIFFALFFVVVIVGYVGWTQVRPLPTITATTVLHVPATTAQAVSLPWPSYGQAAVGTPGYGVIATHGDQKPVPTASTAKVITALAVLRQYPLQVGSSGPIITIKQADIDSYNSYVAKDGSVVSVSLGEQLTERRALEALLLPSANNMADTLARWAFGSIDNYLAYANDYAKSLGLTSVKVTDPSGLAATTVASAHDMTVIGELAMLNSTFASIVAEPTAVIPGQGTVQNYNALLGKNGNIGIKTGNNDEDLGAYLFAQKQVVDGHGFTIIGAVMDGPDLGTVLHDSASLAQASAQNFSYTTFAASGKLVATYQVPWQGAVNARVSDDLSALTWNSDTTNVSSSIDPVIGSKPANSTVGSVSLTDGTTKTKTTVAVKLDQAIQSPSRLWRLQHPF